MSHHCFLLALLNLGCTLPRCKFTHTKSATIQTEKVRMDTFGEWLRQQRCLRRLTREELAGRVGCSVSLLEKIEVGERRPSAQIAELMANCLDVPPEDRSTFVRVARGELNVGRLLTGSKPTANASISSPRSNLPIFPTPLIGRQREVEQLSQLLGDPQCRLLTLVGPGGIGKTRLAIEVACRMQDSFADGVYLVPLASANSTRVIVPVTADAIGFAFQSAGYVDPKKQLFSYLKEKQALLLMDNLEQLLTEPGIEVLPELIANSPQVRLLATSRESLELQDEWVFEVQGLPIPEGPYAEASAQNTSVELFLRRAQRAHVGFDAMPEDYPRIVHICQLVDGNPLGIELAAAWVRTLSCDEIAQEIERGLGFLTVSARDIPARHRSMHAVFDHSWRLLTEEEQRVLLRLSAFRGGFRREAAEEVAGATISVLSTLIMKSLIRRDGAGRYDLHELIRQFATEQFAEHPDEQTAAQTCHSKYYLTLFSGAKGRLQSMAQRGALAELTAEMDNFRAAWYWAIAHHDFAHACQVAGMLYHVYELRAWFEEGETVAHDAVEALRPHTEETNPDEALTLLHVMRVHLAYFRFRLGKSAAPYESLLSSATFLQSSRDQFAAAYSMWYLGIVCWTLGRFTEAIERLHVSLEKARALGERWHEAAAGEYIGIVMHERGEYKEARLYFIEALALARQLGDPMLIAHVLAYMSRTLIALGRTTEADSILQESLALAQEIGYRPGIGHALDGLGRLAQTTNRDKASTLFAASYNVYKETGDLRNMARVLSHQGYNSLARGDDADAQSSFLTALRLTREGGFTSFALDALAGLASLQVKQGDMEHALELLWIVLSHPAGWQDTKAHADHLRAELEAQLTPAQVEVIQIRAQEKTLEGTVADLLK
jgi:predicted ATPase/transcriptional regulator with XRE-family HTH domain